MVRTLTFVAVASTAACSFTGGGVPLDGTASADESPPSDVPVLPGDAGLDAPPDATPPSPWAMTGLRWVLPCINNGTPNPNACTCAANVVLSTLLLDGDATMWRVRLRIRGVMEHMQYQNGVQGPGNWYVGGNATGGDNYYKLTVSSPPSQYFINSGDTNQNHSWIHDYEAELDVAGNAGFTFESSGQDSIQWEGVDPSDVPISLPGVTDPVQPYNGQWARIDVLSVVAI